MEFGLRRYLFIGYGTLAWHLRNSAWRLQHAEHCLCY